MKQEFVIRTWARATRDTFDMPPVKALLDRIIQPGDVVIDPFARNSTWATYSNDLNPETTAQYHMDAEDFLDMLIEKRIQADVCLFDPPYSPRQISECYKNVGRAVTKKDTQNARLYRSCKDKLAVLTRPQGLVVCCGWSSVGMGKSRGFELMETRLVCHGGAHNDTIITVNRLAKGYLEAA